MNRLISSQKVVPAITSFVRNSLVTMSSSTSSPIKPVTHVIFDLDGLLLDTEKIYENSVREICQSFGKEYPRDVRLKVLGTTEQKSADIVITEVGLPIAVDEFLKRMNNYCRQQFNQLNFLSGAEQLILHLHKTNIPFCLATSSSHEMTEIKTKNHRQLFDLFHHKVMGSTDPDVKVGKPAPDIFLVAAQRFRDQPHPSQCLVFEDSPAGIQAAVSAGMQSVMVPDKIIETERRKHATIVLESLEHFEPQLFGLPPIKC